MDVLTILDWFLSSETLERADLVNSDPLRDSDIELFPEPSRLEACDPRCEFMARRRENLGSETSGKGSAWNIMLRFRCIGVESADYKGLGSGSH